MDPQAWRAVDDYLAERYLDPEAPETAAAAAALADSERAGLPPINVSPLQGRLLEVLARAVGAARILEVGTLGGYSTIWLARALPAGGRLVTLELDPRRAEVAVANLARAGLADRVEVRVGPAAVSLAELARSGTAPFDLVFIDADKGGYPEYLGWALRLTRPGSLVVADNVVSRLARGLGVERAGPPSSSGRPSADEDAGVRRFHDLVAAEPRLLASTVQTVGAKGYDGFTLALVR